MKIDFDTVLSTPKGEPFRARPLAQDAIAVLAQVAHERPGITLADAADEVQARLEKLQGAAQTLADASYDALVSCEKAQKGSAVEKRERARLAAKICSGGVVEIAESEKATLLETLGQQLNALALIAAEDALVEYVEPKAEQPEPAAEAAE